MLVRIQNQAALSARAPDPELPTSKIEPKFERHVESRERTRRNFNAREIVYGVAAFTDESMTLADSDLTGIL